MSTLPTKAPALKRFFIMPFLALNAVGFVYAVVRLIVTATGSGHASSRCAAG